MSNLDDLRRSVLERDEPEDQQFGVIASGARPVQDDKIFGLDPVERMFLSVGLFLVVGVFSVLLLLVTDSIVMP